MAHHKTYEHRYLNDDEKVEFVRLYKHNISTNLLVSMFMNYPLTISYFPIMWSSLLCSVYLNCEGIHVLSALIGFLFLKLKFDFSHMFAHSLMLEYDLWTIEKMPNIFGNIACVIYNAFDHHHEDGTLWLRKLMKQSDGMYYLSIVFNHWESFSIFTQLYPFLPLANFITKSFLVYTLHSPIILSFVTGHELGVFLLPISHDWVHSRYVSKYFYYPFKLFEALGIFATRKEHNLHHQYDTPLVYKSFTSSGIYSKRLDRYLDEIWTDTHTSYDILQNMGFKIRTYYPQHVMLDYTIMIYSCMWIFMFVLYIFS